MNILAFDFGGTYIKWGIVCTKEKMIIKKGKFDTVDDTIEMFLKPIFEVCDLYFDQVDAISISSPGSVDKKLGIVNGVSAIKVIHGPNFKKIFLDKYGIFISIENDANCSLLGECFNATARGLLDVNLIVIGTGVGGACLVNGDVYDGYKNYGVEFGLQVQKYHGKLTRLSTSCGMYNIIKDFSEYFGEKISGFDVMSLYESDDEFAYKYMEGVFEQLAIACYNLAQSFNPQLILIGGGISKNKILVKRINYYFDKISSAENNEGVRPQILSCKNDNDANLFGATYNYLKEKNMD